MTEFLPDATNSFDSIHKELTFREALIKDIPGMHKVRLSVKENILNNPALVTESDYQNFLTGSGKGWLAERSGSIVGFAIIDTERNNIWALFVDPLAEKKGIGNRLQNMMLKWHFERSDKELWLTTAPGTRAELFYELTGWNKLGIAGNGEMKFVMTASRWQQLCND